MIWPGTKETLDAALALKPWRVWRDTEGAPGWKDDGGYFAVRLAPGDGVMPGLADDIDWTGEKSTVLTIDDSYADIPATPSSPDCIHCDGEGTVNCHACDNVTDCAHCDGVGTTGVPFDTGQRVYGPDCVIINGSYARLLDGLDVRQYRPPGAADPTHHTVLGFLDGVCVAVVSPMRAPSSGELKRNTEAKT